jgi:hypothetical protein
MNIFVVDYDPVIAAQSLVDRHVVKMILETAQLLSTAVKFYNTNIEGLYKSCYVNHPCSKWTRESRQNFQWLCKHGNALLDEYSYRYYKYHKSSSIIDLAKSYSELFPDIGLTNFVLAMPNEYKVSNAIESYRNYYRGAKRELLIYTKREPPIWVSDLARRK